MLNTPYQSITVVYKRSRYAYAKERGFNIDPGDPIGQELLTAHNNNLAAISVVKKALKALGFNYRFICRSDLKQLDLTGLIIALGGDGTLLDTSHYCQQQPLLGINSDPDHSIGALCLANLSNFTEIVSQIFSGALKPEALTRLALTLDGQKHQVAVLNDLLFCHKNPAAMARFYMSLNGKTEAHRSSGLWVSTPAGSSGGIFSSGAQALDLSEQRAIFRAREPYWSDQAQPQLLAGLIEQNQHLTIRSNMTDARVYLDGPHKFLNLKLGSRLDISISSHPLYIFGRDHLNKNRQRLTQSRLPYRQLLDEV